MTGHRRLRLILPAIAVALSPLLACGAQAQERGEFMRDALSGIGLLEKRQDPIDYHERPGSRGNAWSGEARHAQAGPRLA